MINRTCCQDFQAWLAWPERGRTPWHSPECDGYLESQHWQNIATAHWVTITATSPQEARVSVSDYTMKHRVDVSASMTYAEARLFVERLMLDYAEFGQRLIASAI